MIVVVNPTAGRGKARRKCQAVVECLRRQNVCVEVITTDGKGHAAEIGEARTAEGIKLPDTIVACGGDGLVQEIAHTLAARKAVLGERCPALGIIPGGRCNDFARALRIPSDLKSLAVLLTRGRSQPIDLGSVNGRSFCTVATIGVDAAISDFVNTMRIGLKGKPAYLYGILCVLPRYRPPVVKVTGLPESLHGPLLVSSFANTRFYGGGIPIAPQADSTDGLLDLCMIKPVSIIRLLRLVPRVIRGRHENDNDVRFARAKRISVETDEAVTIWADGEPMGKTPALVEIMPKAIRIITPAADTP